MSDILIIIGGILALIGIFSLLINAFSTSIGWGLAYLFLPLASVLYIIKFWAKTWKPTLTLLIGLNLAFAGISLENYKKENQLFPDDLSSLITYLVFLAFSLLFIMLFVKKYKKEKLLKNKSIVSSEKEEAIEK